MIKELWENYRERLNLPDHPAIKAAFYAGSISTISKVLTSEDPEQALTDVMNEATEIMEKGIL